MISTTRILIVIAATAILVVACSSPGTSAPTPMTKATPTGGSTPATGEGPAPTAEPPGPDDKVAEPAPVNSVAIELDGAAAEVVLVTGLPNACYEPGGQTAIQEGSAITVSVMNLGPAPGSLIACAEIYGLVERRIPLRHLIEPCAMYSVEVNGDLHQVQAIGPAVTCMARQSPVKVEPPQDADPGDGMTPVLAPIDGLSIEVAESAPPQYFLTVQSGLPNGCARFDGYTVDRKDPTIVVQVTNLVPEAKDVVCTQQYRTVESRIALGTDFEPGGYYTIQVNDVTHSMVAQGGESDGPPPGLDQPFEIGEGETVQLQKDLPAVNLESVISDSRCPANVTCVWAGEAKVTVSLLGADGQSVGAAELVLGPDPDAYYSNIGDHSVTLLALDPYPGTPEAVAQGDEIEYTAFLLVSKPFVEATEDPGAPEIDLQVEAVDGRPLTFQFTAEIAGGRDNSRDLYCQGTSWEFGDGMGVAVMPGCIPWNPNATLPRHHVQTYTYEKPGTYEATFSYGPLGPVAVKVEVK